MRTAQHAPVPPTTRASVLGGPEGLSLVDKPTPAPEPAEVPARIDTVAICAIDLEVIRCGAPALIEGGPPFHMNFTPGHAHMARWRRSAPAWTSSRSTSA